MPPQANVLSILDEGQKLLEQGDAAAGVGTLIAELHRLRAELDTETWQHTPRVPCREHPVLAPRRLGASRA